MQSGAQLVNNGLVDLQSDGAMAYNGGTAVAFSNAGTVVKSAGAGVYNLSGVNFSNTGTVDVASGTIQLPSNFTNNGILMGDGAFTTSALINAGHVKPGDGIGELTVNGNYTQNTLGVLDIQIGDLANFDLLTVNGTAALDGMLALSCFGACSLAIGDEIVILDSTGNLTGTFVGGVTLSGFATGAFDVVYDSVNDLVLLRVTDTVTAVPEPETWAMLLVGLGLVGFAARRRA